MKTTDLNALKTPMTREDGLDAISRRYGVNLIHSAKQGTEKLIVSSIQASTAILQDHQSPVEFTRSCIRWVFEFLYHEGRRSAEPESVPIPSFEYSTFRNGWKVWDWVKLPYDFQYENRTYRLITQHTGTVVDAKYMDPNGRLLSWMEGNPFTGSGVNQYDALKTLHAQLISHGIEFNF